MPKEEPRAARVFKTLNEFITLLGNLFKFTILVFFTLFILSALASSMPKLAKGNVAVIPINGLIATESDDFMQGTDSQDIAELIEEANENEDIKAILFDIDSPGGTPVATDQIAQAIKEINKTTIAVIGETGASGAYWIATAANKIYANRMSVTGSIGVTSSRLEFGGLLTDYNITYRRLVAGKYKDLGTRWRAMTSEEQQLYQTILDDLHDEFITTVSENRKLEREKVKALATGFVYLGSEAKELGLVDELGGKKEALKYLEQTLNITAEPVDYEKQKTFFEELSGVTSNAFYNLGRGMTNQQAPAITLT
ncbi:signal peptide peptidase SppA [Candidatus Woesearchaeota archaeon]|nr:signal peptide peptidase SppA [Candidatus Woesearchaeota archaeon]